MNSKQNATGKWSCKINNIMKEAFKKRLIIIFQRIGSNFTNLDLLEVTTRGQLRRNGSNLTFELCRNLDFSAQKEF